MARCIFPISFKYLDPSYNYSILQVIAESLSEDEIAGLKEMFKMIDTDNSGQITYEELKVGLERAGANLKESEILALMKAVCVRRFINAILYKDITYVTCFQVLTQLSQYLKI